jgi:hypothetical protein
MSTTTAMQTEVETGGQPARHEVVYVVTDAEGNEYTATQAYHGHPGEVSARREFWRQRLSEVLPPDLEVAGVRIAYVIER